MERGGACALPRRTGRYKSWGTGMTANLPFLSQLLGTLHGRELSRSRIEENGTLLASTHFWACLEAQDLHILAARALEQLDVALSEAARALNLTRELRLRQLRAAAYLRDLGKLLALPALEAVPVMILRGPHLTEILYQGRYGLREFGDVDVAVAPGDLSRFVEAVAAYNSDCTLRTRTGRETERKAWYGSRIEVNVGKLPLDIHWQLAKFYNFHVGRRQLDRQEGIWRRARRTSFRWGECYVLSEADLAAHLAEHLAIQHDFKGRWLRNLLEFVWLVDGSGLSAETLQDVAEQRGSPTAVAAAATAAVQVLDLPESLSVIHRLHARATPRLRRRVGRTMLARTASWAKVGEEGNRTDPSVRDAYRATRESIEMAAHLCDGWPQRSGLLQSLLWPSRSLVSYALDRDLSIPAYLLYLSVHPLVLSSAIPAVGLCLWRQAEDVAGGLRALAGNLAYGAVGTVLTAQYYAGNLYNTGLAGPGAWRGWLERVRPPQGLPTQAIWVHAAGPGDAGAAVGFICSLRRLMPTFHFHVTCGTRGAWSYVSHNAPDIPVHWLPFDLPWLVKWYVSRTKPLAFIGAQGEFWPNLLRALRQSGTPSACLRVDMLDWATQAEFPTWVRPLYEKMLLNVDAFSVRSEMHRERLLDSKVAAERIFIGNDYRVELLKPADDTRRLEFLSLFGATKDRPLVVLATWRLDEIEAIIERLMPILDRGNIRLLIASADMSVPSKAAGLLAARGLGAVRRSKLGSSRPIPSAILLDTVGELFQIYAAASITIVGDTFPPAFSIGCNLWEPLVQGCPVVYGPSLPSDALTFLAEAQGLAFRASGYPKVAQHVAEALSQPCARDTVREGAQQILQGQSSASAYDAELLYEWLRACALARTEYSEQLWRLGKRRVLEALASLSLNNAPGMLL